MLVGRDDARMKTVLEQVAAASVPPVEGLRVPEGERVHPAGERIELTLHDEVEVVLHQAVGEQPPVRAQRGEAQEAQEARAVVVIAEDVAAVDAAHRQVEDAGLGKVVPGPSRHALEGSGGTSFPHRRFGPSSACDVSRGLSPATYGAARRFDGDSPPDAADTDWSVRVMTRRGQTSPSK
jgi:hypothetical protein